MLAVYTQALRILPLIRSTLAFTIDGEAIIGIRQACNALYLDGCRTHPGGRTGQ